MSKNSLRRSFSTLLGRGPTRGRKDQPTQPVDRAGTFQVGRRPTKGAVVDQLLTETTEPSKPRNRRRHQVKARAAQREHGVALKAWLQERQILAQKRRAAAAKARAKALAGKRGADRVPEHARPVTRDTSWVHQHEPVQRSNGRWVKGLPYRNPDRAARLEKSGRLRRDLES